MMYTKNSLKYLPFSCWYQRYTLLDLQRSIARSIQQRHTHTHTHTHTHSPWKVVEVGEVTGGGETAATAGGGLYETKTQQHSKENHTYMTLYMYEMHTMCVDLKFRVVHWNNNRNTQQHSTPDGPRNAGWEWG